MCNEINDSHLSNRNMDVELLIPSEWCVRSGTKKWAFDPSKFSAFSLASARFSLFFPLLIIAVETKHASFNNSFSPSIIIQEGYAASRSHVEPNAIKTNCPMASCIDFVLKIRT